ncbi:MAG: hypothetical protein NVSMB27_48880 [Ktedonobacteraceae bacterium]
MAKVQKVYTREFKEEAVRLAQTSGKSIVQVARELGISDTSIHYWRKELAEHDKEAFHHLYSHGTELAVPGGYPGCVFASGCGMVHVGMLR